jgi:hypothetical protein
MFSFFKSYYVDDTAFIFQPRRSDRRLKLIIVSLSTFWSDYSHWKYEKRRRLENGGHSLSKAGQESSAADMEDIEIDDRFMSFCIKFKYLGSYFVPELNDTADITERKPGEKAIRLHEQAITGQQKDTDRYPSQALSSDCCNIALWEAGQKKRQVQTGSFPPWMSPQDVRADDVGCSRETDHE